MARSTRLVILTKNIDTLWGRKRFLLPVTYFPTNLVYPFTLRVTGIKSTLNAALGAVLGGFRTTPTYNLLYESSIPTIKQRRDHLTTKLFKNIIRSKGTPIHNLIKPITRRKKWTSTLERAIGNCQLLNIPFQPTKLYKTKPPGQLQQYIINTSLHNYKKNKEERYSRVPRLSDTRYSAK